MAIMVLGKSNAGNRRPSGHHVNGAAVLQGAERKEGRGAAPGAGEHVAQPPRRAA